MGYFTNKIGGWKIFQQTPDGTLIRFSHDCCAYQKPPLPGQYNECALYQGIDVEDLACTSWDNRMAFIERNNTDANSVDNFVIKPGLFGNTGTYQYTTTLGARKTVFKIKRLQ